MKFYLIYSFCLAFLFFSLANPRLGLYFFVPLLPAQQFRYRLFTMPFGNQLVDMIVVFALLGLLARGGLRHIMAACRTTIGRAVLAVMVVTTFGFLWGCAVGLPVGPRLTSWKNYMLIFLLYFISYAAFQEVKQIRLMTLIMSAGMLFLDNSFYRSVGHRDFSHFNYALRSSGPLGWVGVNGLAALAAQMSVLGIAVWFRSKEWWIKLAAPVVLIANSYALIFSLSRGGYVAFGVGVMVLGFLRYRILLVGLLVIGLSWQFVAPGAVKERIEMTGDAEVHGLDASAGKRIDLWAQAWDMFLSQPLFGAGWDGFRFHRQGEELRDTHNLYIKVLAETGILGFGVILWLHLGGLWSSYRLFRAASDPFLSALGLGLTGYMAAMIVANLFGDRWTYMELTGFTMILLGCVSRGHAITLEQQPASAAKTTKAPAQTRTAANRFRPVPVIHTRPAASPAAAPVRPPAASPVVPLRPLRRKPLNP